MEFPIFKTKLNNISKKFDLTDPNQRREYFDLKAGKEIKKLREYLKKNSFIAYMIGKKNSGKGTYAKMFKEIVDSEKIEHLSVGDIIRDIEKRMKKRSEKKKIISFLKENYRGFIPLKEIIKSFKKRNTKSLLPSELILALVKMEIADRGEDKSFFIDGFPRDMDQISYSLFFRDLIGYRKDPDVFVLINIPESVINERIKHRVICPLCQTSRSIKLLPTKEVGYDKRKKEFYLVCDNSQCRGARMVKKEGDELGIANIKSRLEKDERIIKKVLSLSGVPKVMLNNVVPVQKASKYVNDYEITPEYNYKINDFGRIEAEKKPWKIENDQGKQYYSLMPPPVVISLIKQLVEVLVIDR